MKVSFDILMQLATSFFVIWISLKLQKIDRRRQKHDEEMSQYLFNLTNCLVVTVDSVAEIADEIATVKNIDELTSAIKNIKQAKKELALFQQKLAADRIVRGQS